MKIKVRYLFAIIWSFCLVSACNNSDQAATAETDVPLESPAKSGFEPLPIATMQKLVDSVDHVDYVFYELTFSMSMDQLQGIRYAIAKIGEKSVVPNTNCKPLGRVYYESRGKPLAVAQLYFTAGCAYLEFFDDNDKVAYVNEISQVGKDFLNQQFSQLIKDYQRVE